MEFGPRVGDVTNHIAFATNFLPSAGSYSTNFTFYGRKETEISVILVRREELGSAIPSRVSMMIILSYH